MNKKSIIYLILIILVIGIYYYQSDSDDELANETIDLSQSPLYQSKNMLTVVYDPSGELIYKIAASQVEYFEQTENNNNETRFGRPNVTLYDREKSASWNIQANQARLTKDRMLYLTGNVQLNNLTPDAQLERILTENAEINLITQDITSDDEVTIQGPGFNSTGNKLRGNLRDKKANLLENVKTCYRSGNLTSI